MGKVAYVGAPLDDAIENVVEINVLRILYRDVSFLKKIEEPLILTSKRGIIALKLSNVRINSPKVYCIGQKTAEYLRKLYGLKGIVPTQQDSEGLADLFVSKERSGIIVSSDKVSSQLLKTVEKTGLNIRLVTAYSVEENEEVDYSPLSEVGKILVGSSNSFKILIARQRDVLSQKEVYAIGIPTYRSMIKAGFDPAGYFKDPNIKNIVSFLVKQD